MRDVFITLRNGSPAWSRIRVGAPFFLSALPDGTPIPYGDVKGVVDSFIVFANVPFFKEGAKTVCITVDEA